MSACFSKPIRLHLKKGILLYICYNLIKLTFKKVSIYFLHSLQLLSFMIKNFNDKLKCVKTFYTVFILDSKQTENGRPLGLIKNECLRIYFCFTCSE